MDLRNILVPGVSGGSIGASREYFQARRCNRSRPQGCECSSLLPKLPGDSARLGAATGERGSCDKTVHSSAAAAAARRDDPAGRAIWHQSSVVAALRGSPCNPSASALCACALWRRRRLKPVGQKPLHNGSVCPRLRPLNLQLPLHGSALRGLPLLRVQMTLLCHLRLGLTDMSNYPVNKKKVSRVAEKGIFSHLFATSS